MEVHHSHHHAGHAKKKFQEYITEFLMLFAAVTLGFFAENKREHYVEREREHHYMQSFYEDLKRDTTEMLTTVGKINSEYQAIEFSSNSQPQYVLMGPDGKKLPGVQPRAYNTNIDEFIDFLDAGKKAFDSKY